VSTEYLSMAQARALLLLAALKTDEAAPAPTAETAPTDERTSL
jgi:hypothetical protein